MKHLLLFAEEATSTATEKIKLWEMEWSKIAETTGLSLLTFLGFYIVAKILRNWLNELGSHASMTTYDISWAVVKTTVIILNRHPVCLGVDVSALVAGLGLTGFIWLL